MCLDIKLFSYKLFPRQLCIHLMSFCIECYCGEVRPIFFFLPISKWWVRMFEISSWKLSTLAGTCVVIVQSLSCVQLFVTPWIAACQASMSFTISVSLLSHVHWVSDAMQLSHPLSPPFLLFSVFPRIRVFCNKSALCIRWPKSWSFSSSISPSNEYSEMISFRINWFDLLAV